MGHFYIVGDNTLFAQVCVTSVNNKAELKARAYNASIILGTMEEAQNPVNILILDACRNNPYRGFKGGAKGLTTMTANSKGLLIAFATAPNTLSSDGSDRNGLYTKYLKRYITQPGLKIQDMFMKVRQAVVTESPEQIPWENSSLVGDLCLAGCNNPTPQPVEVAVVKPSPQPAPEPVKPTPAPVYTPPAPARQSFEPEMVAIKAGCFMMGSPEKEIERRSDERQHKVCVKAFKMGKYEVTQAQWQAVMGNNPSYFKGENLPVEQVNWNDVQEFIQKLSAQTGKNYRLPTEAEWEYAARAGTTTPFYTENCINTNQANYNGKYDYNNCGAKTGVYKRQTVAVGYYPANGYGLHDMAGNVWEWVCSAYNENYNGSETQCSNSSTLPRVIRGGSWDFYPSILRSATRYSYSVTPDELSNNVGFRLSRM